MLFALVCGYLPFEDPNTSALYKKILSGEYKPAKWISSEVKDLIRKILEVDPKKRYTVAHIKRHAWYNMVSEAEVPKDLAHASSTNAEFRKETLVSIDKAGFDPQAVNDAVSSNSCNSLSALYYLFEQKLYAERLIRPENRADANLNVAISAGDNQSGASDVNPPIANDTKLDGQSPPAIPVLQPLKPPPQRLRPVPNSSRNTASTNQNSKATTNDVVNSPRGVPPIISTRVDVSRGAVDRRNWRLRSLESGGENGGDASNSDVLSVVSNKAVLQSKDGVTSPSGKGYPRNRPVPPSVKAPVSPRKQILEKSIHSGPPASKGDPQISKVTVETEIPNTGVAEQTVVVDTDQIVANPPPDEFEISEERPSTRRSHLRTPGRTTRPSTAEYGEFGDVSLPGDTTNTSQLPISKDPIISEIFDNEPPEHSHLTNKTTDIEVRAPEAPKDAKSSSSAGGRRGRHLKPASVSSADKDDGVRPPESVSLPSDQNKSGIKSAYGAKARAPETVTSYNNGDLSARDAAARNKASQGGSLAASLGGLVVQ